MTEFVMPSLGADMEAGTLVEWLKKPGETVKHGDIIAVVETQKGAIEVECFEDGVFDHAVVEIGVKVPVGAPLAIIRTAADTAATVAAVATTAPSPPPPSVPTPAAPAPITATTAPVAASGGEIRASPAARRLATERGLDLGTIKGTGPGGAIVSEDVERAGGAPEPATARRTGLDLGEMRKAIAAAMARSKREIPHYYLSHAMDFGSAQDWLGATNAKREPPERILAAAVQLKAVALALRTYPEFNGFFKSGAFEPGNGIHLGTAIAIRGGGLAAPAIRDTDRLTLDQLMVSLRDLVARTRAGRLRSSEFTDATITVSSLGERGVDALYGVIYPPQVALVGLGTPRPEPRAVKEPDGTTRIAARPVLTVTLAADHRVSDGHRGALFLLEIDRLLQKPEAL